MKRKFKRLITFIVLIICFLWIIWGNITVGVTHYQVASARLPAAFEHFKIAVISDFHNAEFGENNVSLISIIENEKPDIIAVTGDLVDSRRTNIEVAENLIKNLVKIAPCYFVTGNHEARIGKQYQDLEKKLLDVGVVVLHDKTVSVSKDDETIQFVGLDDPNFRDSDFLIQENTGEYRVLLSHRPEAFNIYVSGDVDLVLSGHAHGGQFRLPFIGGIIAPNQGLFPKYDAGKYSESNTTLIVSRGVGNSIIPIRFNNRPEIVIVELINDR